MQAVVEVDAAAVEISQAGRVDQHAHTLAFENVVVRLREVEGHPVLETRATPALDKHAQLLLRIALGGAVMTSALFSLSAQTSAFFSAAACGFLPAPALPADICASSAICSLSLGASLDASA